jgi:predicted regulator of Ras-like GTPase activity (Roadblock/LC7/MglB family)
MRDYLNGLIEEMRLFLPEVRGLMILTPDGLPFDFVKAPGCPMCTVKDQSCDPISMGGLISFAVSSLTKALEGLGDEGFDMTYVRGKDVAIVAGKVGDFYLFIVADADAKLGPLFMEFNRRKNEIAKILEQYVWK